MFIEANVHGNEIQGAEVVALHDLVPDGELRPHRRVTRLVDERVFYILPSVNPDGRDYFLDNAGSGARTGHIPVDSDGDGLFDEDGPTTSTATASSSRSASTCPGRARTASVTTIRVCWKRVSPASLATTCCSAREGIDDDGDGRVNEDPVGGYDPEPQLRLRLAAELHPGRVDGLPVPAARGAGHQRLHDDAAEHCGLPVLPQLGRHDPRGPGAAWQGTYPQPDIRVYDEIGENGERMLAVLRLPRHLAGLYTVHGGSIDWTNDGLGIISYSNELWNGGQYFNSPLLQEQRRIRITDHGQRSRFFFDDFLEFGDQYVEWAPFDHPTYGPVEMGGLEEALRPREPALHEHGAVPPQHGVHPLSC